jgi:ElaB/YqjD/DUF883 family membrane-anchored ribosome-binding protein
MSRRSGAQGPTTNATGFDAEIGGEPEFTPDTASSETADSETLRRKIEETREALGDTAEALAQKADLKAQVKGRVDDRKAQLHQLQENAKAKAHSAVGHVKERSGPIGGITAMMVGAVGLALVVRSRNRRNRKRRR